MQRIPDVPMNGFDLDPGERILWQGKPAGGILFRSHDWVFIPFSLFWTGLFLSIVFAPDKDGHPHPFNPISLLFIVVGAYILVGRFLVDMWMRRKTDYAVTSNRVIVRSGLFVRKVTSINLKNLPPMTTMENANGSGTIAFGETSISAMYRGFRFPGMNSADAPAFEKIPDVRKVERLIRAASGNA